MQDIPYICENIVDKFIVSDHMKLSLILLS